MAPMTKFVIYDIKNTFSYMTRSSAPLDRANSPYWPSISLKQCIVIM